MISLFGKPEPTLLEKLKESVSKTRTELAAKVEQILTGDRPVDPELLKQLESALLGADIGVTTTKEVLAALREQVNEHKLEGAASLKHELKNQIVKILAAAIPAVPNGKADTAPRVLFVVGVNGTGKTTTIGKLANRLKKEGASVMLCAADTFRAAAIEQLEVWAQRSGVELIKQKSGSDPSAVIFDALTAARARSSRRGDRGYRRPAAHEIEPDGGAGKNEAHGREESCRARRMTCCWCWTQRPGKMG